MARWEPNARGRLEEAAMELFTARGYDKVTAADIAEHAGGLTERTFFRYFADKREVLFGRTAELEQLLKEQIAGASPAAAPLAAIARALDAMAELMEPRRKHSRARQAIIAAHAELQERERAKLAGLAVAIADALRARGVSDVAASLAGEAGIAAFRIAYERWLDDGKTTLALQIRAALDELAAVVAPVKRTRR